MPNDLEIIVYAFVNYVPYLFLALYPFQSVLRYSKRTTGFLLFLATVLDVFTFWYTYRIGLTVHHVGTYVITAIQLILYFVAVRSRPGRMLFHLFMIKNIANYIVIAAKYLESVLFPKDILSSYSWTNTVCMMLLIILLFPFLMRIISKYFNKDIRDAITPRQWRYLWLIPIHYYIIWAYLFYYSSSKTPLELATSLSFTIFMTLFILGQILVYVCVARLVLQFSNNAMLQEKNNRLEAQSLQYRSIQERIKEITVLKHDMRHHLNAINLFAQNEEYDKLKAYLADYVKQFPDSKIRYCDNTSLNMLMVYYDERCKRLNIPLEINLALPENIGLTDSEITVLFGNLLENAVDASVLVPEGKRRITCNGKVLQNQLVLFLENTYVNEFNTDSSGSILSTKHEGFGIGTQSCKRIVADHGGTFRLEPDNGTFSISIMMPVHTETH